MNGEFLEKMFEHNNWANDRIIQACAALERRAAGCGTTIRDQGNDPQHADSSRKRSAGLLASLDASGRRAAQALARADLCRGIKLRHRQRRSLAGPGTR